MPRLAFTANLERHVACPVDVVDATTVQGALEAYFERHPKVRSYIVDEQGSLRRHVTIFVDGKQVRDRSKLSDKLAVDSEIYVMQALSGG